MKINWQTVSKLSQGEADTYSAYAFGLGLPETGSVERRGRLAVLGGGPSLTDAEWKIRMWDGDIWAINGAFQWCRERNIPATLFATDPAMENLAGARRAILAQTCPPEVFVHLMNEGSEIRLHPIGPGRNATGPSTATAAIKAGLLEGYDDITWFGCEGSFKSPEATHAYDNSEPTPFRLLVECDGHQYQTEIEYLLQCEYLAGVIRKWPDKFHEESGGLLRAMVRSGDYDLVAATQAVHDRLVYA